MSDEGSYAPQSPDLSAYHSAQISAQPPAYRYSHQQLPPQSHIQTLAYQPSPASASFSPHHNKHYVQSPSSFSANTMPRRPRADTDMEDEWAPGPSVPASGGRNPKKQRIEEEVGKPAPGSLEGIEVKTKFPVARIKRIMQADEDVGKVAQVTPTAVSKALELFMISLVTKAAIQARSKSAKKVTAAHLKQVIENDLQFDFLGDIIAKVPDAPAPKKDEDSEGTGEGKKKRAAPRRKKKEEDEF